MRQLFIDSRDRISGSTTDFVYQLSETLCLAGGAHRLRVDNLRIPLVIPLIVTGVNDMLYILDPAIVGYYTATLPPGSFDGNTLALVVQTALQAASNAHASPGTWTVVYYPFTAAMSISYTKNFTLLQDAAVLAASPPFVNDHNFATLLFSHGSTFTASGGGSLYSYLFTYVSILPIDVFYLSCMRFADVDTGGPQGTHDTLMCAVVTTAFGSVMNVSMPSDVWIDIPGITTQQLDFQLRDRYYNVIDFVANISFTITID